MSSDTLSTLSGMKSCMANKQESQITYILFMKWIGQLSFSLVFHQRTVNTCSLISFLELNYL